MHKLSLKVGHEQGENCGTDNPLTRATIQPQHIATASVCVPRWIGRPLEPPYPSWAGAGSSRSLPGHTKASSFPS